MIDAIISAYIFGTLALMLVVGGLIVTRAQQTNFVLKAIYKVMIIGWPIVLGHLIVDMWLAAMFWVSQKVAPRVAGAPVPAQSNKQEVVLTEHKGLPVKGYTSQSAERVALADELKEAEERYLRLLDKLMAHETPIPTRINPSGEVPAPTKSFDPAMITLARRRMQEANMWAVRSIFQPTRIELSEDAIDGAGEPATTRGDPS